MAEIEILEYHFPVCAVDKTKGSATSLFGTAWAVSEHLLITAGHVLEAAAAAGSIAIGIRTADTIAHVETVADFQIFPELDVGIILSKFKFSGPYFEWDIRNFSLLTDVQTCGFPYGLDPSKGTLSVRAFKGHIVGAESYQHGNLKCPIIELSFHCPRGLSGAPVLEGSRVLGLVIGNRVTEQEIYSEREKDGSSVYSKVEAMHLGVAVQIRTLLDLKPKFLDTNLMNHLLANGRIHNEES